jgi:hypothetical protein
MTEKVALQEITSSINNTDAQEWIEESKRVVNIFDGQQ